VDKFNSHINNVVTIDKVKENIKIILSCDKYNSEEDNFIGIDPSHH
jgi:hypothetical protein